MIYWYNTYVIARYNTIHWYKIFIAWLFQIIFIIHSTIIHDKIVWCKWLNNLRHFTVQNTSNHTIIWLKSFCLLKSSAWIPLMNSKIIRKIPHRLKLHTACPLLMKSNIIFFISGANSSPPSSRSHWLLFVTPAERETHETGNGVQEGEESSTKWGWARHLFPQKTRTSVTNRCPYTLQIYVLW